MIERSFEFYSDVQGEGPTANVIEVTIEIKMDRYNDITWNIQSIYDKTSQCERELGSFEDEIQRIESWCDELAYDSAADLYSARIEAAEDRLGD
jgi:archaellum component FlaC